MIIFYGNPSARKRILTTSTIPVAPHKYLAGSKPAALLAPCSNNPPVRHAFAVSLPRTRLNAQLWPTRAVIERNSVSSNEVVQVEMTIGVQTPTISDHNV